MEPLASIEDMEEFMDTLLIEEVDITPIGVNENSAISLYDMLVDLNPDWILLLVFLNLACIWFQSPRIIFQISSVLFLAMSLWNLQRR